MPKKDSAQQTYQCTLMSTEETKDEPESIELRADELSQFIQILVKVGDDSKLAHFQVNINDKALETISDLVDASYNVGGAIYAQGKQIQEQDTFEQLRCLANSKFQCIEGAGGARVNT